MLKKLSHAGFCLLFILSSPSLFAQNISITKENNQPVSGAVCPVVLTKYSVNRTGCSYKWSVTNGTIDGTSTAREVQVKWDDTPNKNATVSVTVTCLNDPDNPDDDETLTGTKSELILSVKGQNFNPFTGIYKSSVNVDYCTTKNVILAVPPMYVQGTGGIAQPPKTEVAYYWSLPSGWVDPSSGQSWAITTSNQLTIEATACAKPGSVTVKGGLNYAVGCGFSEQSNSTSITLNGISPAVTVLPPQGFTGIGACVIADITFVANTNVSCVSSYSWQYPPSWQKISQSGNTITLRSSGTSADANVIKATLSYSCGSPAVSGSYTPPFNAPFINAPAAICYAGNTVTISNVNASTAVTWSTSSDLVIVSGQGTQSVKVRAISSATRKPGTISAVLTNCNVSVPTKTVWVGPPDYTTAIEGPSQVVRDYSARYSVASPKGSTNPGTWTITSDWTIYTSNSTAATIVAKTPGLVYLTVTTSNVCGGAYSRKTIEGVNSCPSTFSVFPNPSRGDVTVYIIPPPGGCPITPPVEVSAKSIYQNELLLLNNEGVLVRRETFNGETFKIHKSGLKPGTYYLKVKTPTQSFEERILIE